MGPGVLPNGETIRESAGTRSWEQAERFARKKEADADPRRINQVTPRRTTVKDAIRFLEDEEARGLGTLVAQEITNVFRVGEQRSQGVRIQWWLVVSQILIVQVPSH
jgi:hypothetical protein